MDISNIPKFFSNELITKKNVNDRDRYGHTALHDAVIYHHIHYLGPTFTVENYTCVRNHHELIQKLIDLGADVNAHDYSGCTPLHTACSRNYYEIAQILIEHGADVNARDMIGDTPLHRASFASNLSLVKTLVAHGADVNVQNKVGRTAILFCRDYFNDSPEFEKNQYDVAVFLIEHHIDVHKTDEDKRNALHYACENGRPRLAQLFIDNNINVNAQDIDGNTPLHLAVGANKTETIKLLLTIDGIDAFRENKRGKTPLSSAFAKHKDEIELLFYPPIMHTKSARKTA